MPHHRFIATYDVVMAEPNAPSQPAPTQAPADLSDDLVKSIKLSKPKKKDGAEYIVEKVTRVAARTRTSKASRVARTTKRRASSGKKKRK
jgi:hypothetical protein